MEEYGGADSELGAAQRQQRERRSTRGGAARAPSSLNRDYGELDEDHYLQDVGVVEERQGPPSPLGSGGGGGASGGASSGTAAPISARAKEIGANLQAGASKWFASTKEWIRERAGSGAHEPSDGQRALLAQDGTDAPRQQQGRRASLRRGRSRGDSEGEDEPGVPAQADVPSVVGAVLTRAIEARALYRSVAVRVPPGTAAGGEFVVALPTGESRIVGVPLSGLAAGELVSVPYAGFISDSFGVVFKDAGAPGAGEVRLPPEERLLELYRRHSPEEREALLEAGVQPLSLRVYEGEFGATVHHAAFGGGAAANMLVAEDVIVAVNDKAVQSAAEVQAALAALAEGDWCALRLLRRSPPPKQRCPADHALEPAGLDQPLQLGAHCNRCQKSLFSSRVVHRCDECDWALCDHCFRSAYANLNSERNANEGEPAWASEYEEAFGQRLSFSVADRGAKLRVYWDTTGQWWLGEVLSYAPERGHEVVYEETAGGHTRLSKQTIKDMAKRTYKVLRRRPLAESPSRSPANSLAQRPVQSPPRAAPAPAAAEGDLLGELPPSMPAPPRATEYMLSREEAELLDDVTADLGTAGRLL